MKPIRGTPPGLIVRMSRRAQPRKFISETVQEPSLLTDSTYATWPQPLSQVTMIAPGLGVWPVDQPAANACENHSQAFPSQGTGRRLYTYQVQYPYGKRLPGATL